jgi:hypothetical protein
MSITSLTLHPQKFWSWTLGQVYLRNDPTISPTSLGPGDSVFTSSFLLRVNENWSLRASHYFNASTGTLQEQDYAICRDMRSWTAALTFLVRNSPGTPQDFTVAFTFWLKAFPKAGHGPEANIPSPETTIPSY